MISSQHVAMPPAGSTSILSWREHPVQFICEVLVMTSPIGGSTPHFGPTSVSRPMSRPSPNAAGTSEPDAPQSAPDTVAPQPSGLIGNRINTTA
jgi:hypothetical protein